MLSWVGKEWCGLARLHREQLLEKRRGAMAAKRGRAGAALAPAAATDAPRVTTAFSSLSRSEADAAGSSSVSPNRSASVCSLASIYISVLSQALLRADSGASGIPYQALGNKAASAQGCHITHRHGPAGSQHEMAHT